MTEKPITCHDVANLLSSPTGRQVIMAAYYEKQAKHIASLTDCTPGEVMAIVATLIEVGLIDKPGPAMQQLTQIVGDTKRGTRPELLRDKLVLALLKDGTIKEDVAQGLLDRTKGVSPCQLSERE